MIRSRYVTRSAVFTLAFVGLALLSALTAVQKPRLSHADDRPTAAPASAASASASVAASASAASGKVVPKLPLFRDELPSAEKTEAPKPADWKTASRIDFDRRPVGDGKCRLLRLREWVRLACDGPGAMASHIAGPSEGWSARTDPIAPGQNWNSATHFMQFPVRRGERRLMELRAMETGNYGDGLFMAGGHVVSVQWNEGEPPMITRH